MEENTDKQIRVTLRMPPGIHEKLSNAADESGRSMNAEIVHRLESSFNETEDSPILFSRRYVPEELEDELSEEEAETIIQSMVRAVRKMTKK